MYNDVEEYFKRITLWPLDVPASIHNYENFKNLFKEQQILLMQIDLLKIHMLEVIN